MSAVSLPLLINGQLKPQGKCVRRFVSQHPLSVT